MSIAHSQELHWLSVRIAQGKVDRLRNLQRIREKRDLSQTAMADAIGADLGTYRSWEQGRHWPGANWLPAIASVLDCKIDDLF